MHKEHIQNAIKSGLAYGIGLGFGNLISGFLFSVITLSRIDQSSPLRFMLTGIFTAILVAALGASVGGLIGGPSLKMPPEKNRSTWAKAWRSAVSFAIGYGFVLYPLALVIALFSFYTIGEVQSLKFDLLFAIFGALFGLVTSLLLALMNVRRRGVGQVMLSGMLGFGISGFVLGHSFRRYLMTITAGDLQSGQRAWIVFGLFIFGFVGGAALGNIFSRIASMPLPEKKGTLRKTWWHWAIAGVVILLMIVILNPIIAAVADILQPSDAALTHILESNTIGTHWSDSARLAVSDWVAFTEQPDIAVGDNGKIALVWSQKTTEFSDIFLVNGKWDQETNKTEWGDNINISNSANLDSFTPQVQIDNNGTVHIIWAEATEIFYVQCQNMLCNAPIQISGSIDCVQNVKSNFQPALAIDDQGNLLAAWGTDAGQILFRTWSIDEQSEMGANCISQGGQPRLGAQGSGVFEMVYNTNGEQPGEIQTAQFSDGIWYTSSQSLGVGSFPEIFVDSKNQTHITWCGDDEQLYYMADGFAQTVSKIPCSGRAGLVIDSQGIKHIVWFSDTVIHADGIEAPQDLIYESVYSKGVWLEPSIVSGAGKTAQPTIGADHNGNLHLAWNGTPSENNNIYYASQVQYNCDKFPLSGISQTAFEIARDEKYRPSEDIIPYCQNRYDQLIFAPNPHPDFSDQTPMPNGGFDAFAELAKTAQYEVLFSTMWYAKDEHQDSPGYVFAQAVAELYNQVKANPEEYPRGLTVRILLGNPPEPELEPYSDQVWSVIGDLRNAGIDKMIDLEIGWRVEVANFDGAFPHSHTKVIVVDGKTVIASGFNMQYAHYPENHPSGQGAGRQDLAVQITGPVAQAAHRMYDDLWAGSHQRTCHDLDPFYGLWQATCRDSIAMNTHVPEVMKYYLPGGDSTVFSLYRSEDHDEADQIVAQSVATAQKSVDTMQVNFSMEMICDLNQLYDLCTFENSLSFMVGLIQAAENGAQVRIIIESEPFDGIENFVAIDAFEAEVKARGLDHQVEIRIFEHPVHYKTTLIDDEFLIIGSQNYHYSAFGTGTGLTEYSLGISSPQAVEDFKRLFEYQWERATRR